MKSLKEYITESKKVYEFKIKIAGDCPADCTKRIKAALGKFQVESCSSGKRTPIQETHSDFPEHKNVNVTVFEVTTCYPATSMQIREMVANCLGLTDSCVRVRNVHEEAETALNHANDEKSGEALLNKDYEKDGAQDLVGTNHAMSMLKELGKLKHQGEQYKGVNDKLLADKVPSEKADAAPTRKDKKASLSPIGSKQVKLPTARG